MKEFFHFREGVVKVRSEPPAAAERKVGGLSFRFKRPLGLFESGEIPSCSMECLCVWV